MNKKKILIITIVAVLAVVAVPAISFVASGGIDLAYWSSSDRPHGVSADTVYYVYYSDLYEPTTTYTLDMNGSGEYVLTTVTCGSMLEAKCGEKTRKASLKADVFDRVKKIFSKIERISTGSGFGFYYNKDDAAAERAEMQDLRIMDHLLGALDSLADGEKVMARESGSGWYAYENYDLNNDGTVTKAEFGESYLNDILEDLGI